MAAAAVAARAFVCDLSRSKTAFPKREPLIPSIQAADPSPVGGKTVLQPRLCTLRSYGSGAPGALVRAPVTADSDASPFFSSLADYVDNSRKSQAFETISGRLAMIAFATAVGVEAVTGDSLFKKLDMDQMVEAAGVCLAVVASAAAFAWVSSARGRIGQILTLSCNTFVDSLIDNLVEGMFFDNELNNWSDEI